MIFVILILIIPFALLGGWIWMLGLGALSHIFDVPNLAIGFWQSVLVAFIVNLLIGGGVKSKE